MLPDLFTVYRTYCMPKKQTIRTGEVAETSGQYRPVGYRSEITLVKGKRVPPYDGQAQQFINVDKTKHKR